MKNLLKHKKILLVISSLIIFLVLLLQLANFFYFKDSHSKQIIQDTSIRMIAGLLLIILLYQQGYHLFQKPLKSLSLIGLIILPGILVGINNFPFSAFINGRTTVTEPRHIIYLFAIESLSVGIFEEVAFRGVVLIVLLELFSKNKKSYFKAIIISSALFGLTHLLNLFTGSPLPAVLLQVGYSFLMGSLWAVVFLATQNILFPIILHTIYNFSV